MNVVDLHPEELIDKLNENTLTAAERRRLDAHLAQCASCRFEIAVRADLAEDTSTFEERPQLTLPSNEVRERVPEQPREQSAPQMSRSVRPRSSRRFVLALAAAALMMSAGGAMAAVLTGAVGGHWLGWSPQPKPAVFSHQGSDAKPAAKPKRAVAAPVPAPAAAPQIAASASSAPSAAVSAVAPKEVSAAAPEVSSVAPAPAVAHRSVSASLPARRTLAISNGSRSPGSGASVGEPAATSSPAAAATRVDAAALFADANRARRDGNLDRAVGLYRTLQSRFPSSSESELSRALLAQLLLDRGNPEAALAGFDRYLSDDAPVLSAEALVGRARALEQLGKSSQAAAAWRLVQSRFPGSVHARLAATRLAALGMR